MNCWQEVLSMHWLTCRARRSDGWSASASKAQRSCWSRCPNIVIPRLHQRARNNITLLLPITVNLPSMTVQLTDQHAAHNTHMTCVSWSDRAIRSYQYTVNNGATTPLQSSVLLRTPLFHWYSVDSTWQFIQITCKTVTGWERLSFLLWLL